MQARKTECAGVAEEKESKIVLSGKIALTRGEREVCKMKLWKIRRMLERDAEMKESFPSLGGLPKAKPKKKQSRGAYEH